MTPTPGSMTRWYTPSARKMIVTLASALAAGTPMLASSQESGTSAETEMVMLSPSHAPHGGLAAWLLGRTYRDLWTTEVEAPYLDLDRFAGGLEPLKRGGGQQTRVLHMFGDDQRRYVFRSVDKRPLLGDLPPIQGTLLGAFIHTLPAHLHPGAAPVVAALMEEIDVLHVKPHYVIMPDDPRLGEFREEFAGMLGMIEERPNELEDDEPGFAGFEKIVTTETLRDNLEESQRDSVHTMEFLRIRMVDLLVGDWDRHDDQWRWARVDRPGGGVLWRPIPRDRDHAFVDHSGALVSAGRRLFFPKAIPFNPQIDNIFGLTINSRDLDRELLAEVPGEVFDSVALEVRAQLSDAAIERAVRSMPGPLYEKAGDDLAVMLRSRRESLPDAVRAWYLQLSELVTIWGTDQRDRAEVDRLPDAVAVRLYPEDGDAPYFDRTMPLDEVGEIRIFLRGDDDEAVVRGSVDESILVRIVGGGGDDVLVDSSRVRGEGRRATLHDHRGDNRIVAGPNARVDRRPYENPERELTGFADVLPPDYGSALTYAPWFDYRGTVGPIVGGGVVHSRYAYRNEPYAHRIALRGGYALGEPGFALQLHADFPRRHQLGYSVRAHASQLETFRFFGIGNETAPVPGSGSQQIRRSELLFHAAGFREVEGGTRWSAGPVLKYGSSSGWGAAGGNSVDPYGTRRFGQLGAHAAVEIDRRDDALLPSSGALLSTGVAAYPAVWNVREPFARAEVEARTYLPLPVPLSPTLALRAGGTKLQGAFPVHEAAFLGGSRSLRGYPNHRLAGDAAVYGNVELRTLLTRANLLLVRPLVGLIVLGDAGRVFAAGESSSTWHTAAGLGLWYEFTVKSETYVLSTTYARGSTDRVYVKIGMPF